MTVTAAWAPYPPSSCVRRAWLTLGSLSVDLENAAGGWFCTELDLGYPAVRDVVSNRPDQDGVDDRTQFYGARAISAAITVLAGAGARIDDVADNFAPFMQPSLRPVLHVILDRPGAAERAITVRPAGYAYKIAGNSQRDIQLQWVAADPYLYDPTVQTAISWTGSSTANGRTYDMTFNRVYPTGGGTGTIGQIVNGGDMPVKPFLRVYGPVTAPQVQFNTYTGGTLVGTSRVVFVSGFTLTANQWVDVDTNARTVYRQSDPAQPAFTSLNFANTVWPVLSAGTTTYMVITGSGSMSGSTQVQASWQNAYLT